MTISNEEMADICERAADIIHTRGHYKGAYENAAGNVCAMGAFRIAMFDRARMNSDATQEDWNKQAKVLEFLNTKLPEYPHPTLEGEPVEDNHVPHWNDLEATTQADVEDWFKNIAKDLRNG